MNNIGSVYSRKFKFGKAEKKFQKADKILRKVKKHCEKLKVYFYNNNSLLRFKKEELDEAKKQVKLDSDDFEKFKNKVLKRYKGY